MRIIAVTPYYPPHLGGLEKYAHELHHHLAERGHHITVLTSNLPPSPPNQISRITQHRFPAWEAIYNYPIPAIWTPTFWHHIQAANLPSADIILSVTRFFLTTPLAAALARYHHKPWLHIEHGSDFVTSQNLAIKFTARFIDETLGRYTFTHSHRNIAPSQSAARFINHFDDRPVPVIYRGLPYEEIDHIPSDPAIRQQHPTATILTYAGRFISGKGLSDLIDAMHRIRDTNAVLLMAGDGGATSAITAHIQKRGLKNNVYLLGNRTHQQTIALLKASDIVVNPSHNEGMPTTLLEAAACRRAILATAVGGTPEAFTHNHSAYLIKPHHTHQLATALRHLITSPALRRKLGHHARHSVERQFNWQVATDQYLAMMEQLCQPSSSNA